MFRSAQHDREIVFGWGILRAALWECGASSHRFRGVASGMGKSDAGTRRTPKASRNEVIASGEIRALDIGDKLTQLSRPV
jgi:hypothetical protein